MIRGVLFDLDNTLVDFLRMKRLACEEAARAMISAGAQLGMTAEAAGKALYDHYLEHGIESDDAFQSFLERYNSSSLAWGQAMPERILAAGIQSYLRAKDVLLTPYPGVRRTLVDLTRRQLRLGVVTDAPRLKGWQRLQTLGIAEFFDVVFTFDDTKVRKPGSQPFVRAVEALGMKPFEVLMVGDWPERDIRGAKDAGLRTAWAAYGRPNHEGTHGADAVIDSPTQVLSLLDEWGRP